MIKKQESFKITRTWHVKGKDVQEAIENSKNWKHSEVKIIKLNRGGK